MRARCFALALALAAACGGDDGDAADASPIGTAAVTVEHYGYEIDLETRAASVTLALTALDPGNCIALPSRAAMLDLGSVGLGAAATVATWDGTTLTACLAEGGFAPGPLTLTATITQQPLERWGPSQVGYTVTTDADDQPIFYLISWVGGCDRFGPCDTRPGTFARYTFTVHHRSGVKVLCPGTLAPGDTTSTCTFEHDGGPTYSTFGFIANSSWTETALGNWDGVDVTLFDRPGNGSLAALIDGPYHTGFVTFMTQNFGAYPYGTTLRIASAPTYWSGFEHPGNIVLSTALSRPTGQSYARPVGHVLNHEIAHQWAGDETTLADTYDFVWKEAMAEYLSYVYEAQTSASDALVTATAWKSFAVGAAYHPVPEDAPRPSLLDYYGEVYGPGPMILFRQLESLSSRAQVIAAIASVLGSQRALSVDEVQAALETSTGLDLDNYFDTWVRGAGAPVWPTFRVDLTGTFPAQQVVVTETTPGGVLHGCSFAIELRGELGESTKVRSERGVDGAATTTVATEATFPVTSTVLDPDAECLAYPAASLTAAPRHAPGWSPWR